MTNLSCRYHEQIIWDAKKQTDEHPHYVIHFRLKVVDIVIIKFNTTVFIIDKIISELYIFIKKYTTSVDPNKTIKLIIYYKNLKQLTLS